jgi:hypothetical protein
MPLTENQLVIHTFWKEKNGLGVDRAVEEALADLPECRIVSIQIMNLALVLVVEFI